MGGSSEGFFGGLVIADAGVEHKVWSTLAEQ
jgi:hypothetical protein